MEKYLYNSYSSYFNALSKLGYVNDNKVQSLLIMTFIYNLVFKDYRGIISESDYIYIEKAINCLYGSNCLLPYRDYLKMGKLKIGEYTELAHRLCALENSSTEDSDKFSKGISILDNRATQLETRAANTDSRLDALEDTRVTKPKQDYIEVDDIVI